MVDTQPLSVNPTVNTNKIVPKNLKQMAFSTFNSPKRSIAIEYFRLSKQIKDLKEYVRTRNMSGKWNFE